MKGFHHFTHFLEGFANGRFLVETQACLEGEQRQWIRRIGWNYTFASLRRILAIQQARLRTHSDALNDRSRCIFKFIISGIFHYKLANCTCILKLPSKLWELTSLSISHLFFLCCCCCNAHWNICCIIFLELQFRGIKITSWKLSCITKQFP